jgi:hypothetical protein
MFLHSRHLHCGPHETPAWRPHNAVVRRRSNAGQTLVKQYPTPGADRAMVRRCSRTLVGRWSNTGQTLVKRWSDTGSVGDWGRDPAPVPLHNAVCMKPEAPPCPAPQIAVCQARWKTDP